MTSKCVPGLALFHFVGFVCLQPNCDNSRHGKVNAKESIGGVMNREGPKIADFLMDKKDGIRNEEYQQRQETKE